MAAPSPTLTALIALLDAEYLKLDASNDPVTASLEIASAAPVLKLTDNDTTGDNVNTQVALHDAADTKKGFLGFQATNDLRVQNNYSDGGIDLRTNGANSRLLIDSAGVITLNGGPQIHTGSGSPEGAVTAPIGSLYLRSDGGAGTSHYAKESGAGNTGWVGK